MTLDDISRSLYGLAPGDYTAARNARAKQATAEGDRELASAIRALPKPSAAAWLANTLVRVAPSTIDELIELGAELRRAQSRGLRADMRRLVDHRRSLISELVRLASQAADDAGQPFGTQVERQLEETLEAATADETMAQALRSGHLHESLRFVGFGGAVRAPGTFTSGSEAAGSEVSPAARARTDRAVRALRRADADRQAAQAALRSAEEVVASARRRRDSAVEHHQSLVKQERLAARQRERATGALDKAEVALSKARKKMQESEKEHDRRLSDAR